MNDNDLVWRKSSRSPSGNCVEIAHQVGLATVLVRDSKQPSGPRLQFSPAAFKGLLKFAASQA